MVWVFALWALEMSEACCYLFSGFEKHMACGWRVGSLE